jgi:hypothetical protein
VAVGLATVVVMAPVLFFAVLHSSDRGVPPYEAFLATAMFVTPLGALSFVVALAWMRSHWRPLVFLSAAAAAVFLWWIFAVFVPENGTFYDNVDPGWNECQAVPEGQICL